MITSRTVPSSGDTRFHVALLHAFPLSSVMWDAMAAEFQTWRDDTTLHLINFPGFGDAPVREAWSMPEVASAICDELQRAGARQVILGGISMGGYQAFAFYRAYPNMLRALILSNTTAAPDSEDQKKNREAFAEDALSRGSVAAIERLYSKFVTPETDPEIAVDIRNWMTEADPKAIAAALRAMEHRDDSRDLLPVIAIPSLVISGSRDQVVPAETMREMAQQLTSSTYVELDTAHLSAAEQPAEWAEAVSSFLDRL